MDRTYSGSVLFFGALNLFNVLNACTTDLNGGLISSLLSVQGWELAHKCPTSDGAFFASRIQMGY